MEKKLENPEKKKRIKQPSRPKSAQPGHTPVRPRRLTGGPRLSAAVLPRAHPPSLARCPVGLIYRRQFSSPARSLSLSLSRGLGSSVDELLPLASPFLSLCRGPAVSIPPSSLSSWTSECALAHIAGFLGHDVCPHAQLPS
jgi:hypothetical protein